MGARFGVTLDNHLQSRFQWLADIRQGCNFVTTSEQLQVPLPVEGSVTWADEVRASFPMTCVGCMASETAPHVASGKAPKSASSGQSRKINSAFPADELRDAQRRSARIVLIALGTMAVCDRWNADLGVQSGGNLPSG